MTSQLNPHDPVYQLKALSDAIQMQESIIKSHKQAIVRLNAIIRQKGRTIDETEALGHKMSLPSSTNEVVAEVTAEIREAELENHNIVKEIKAIKVLQVMKDKEILKLTSDNHEGGVSSHIALGNEKMHLEAEVERLKKLIVEKRASLASGGKVLLSQKKKHDGIAAVVRESQRPQEARELAVGIRSSRQLPDEPTMIYTTEGSDGEETDTVTLADYKRLVRITARAVRAIESDELGVDGIDRRIESVMKQNRVIGGRMKVLAKKKDSVMAEARAIEASGVETAEAMNAGAAARKLQLQKDILKLEGPGKKQETV